MRLLVCVVMACVALPGFAVKPGEVSGTAEATCAFRAIGAQHPDPKLRNLDSFAGKLCRSSMGLPRDYEGARRMIDTMGDTYAAYFYVNARTHYIDAALQKAATDGITQVVVLGAGFDTRAYRFGESLPRLRFFEVDLPATIEAKMVRVAEALGGKLPGNVRYAPIDFNSQKLDEVLVPLGFDRKQRSFFLLEGVVMYVIDAGNDATFQFMRKNSPSGSVVVYDYVLKDIIDGKLKDYYNARLAISVAARGEPYVSGWTPAGATAYAKKQGFRVVEDLDHAQLTKRHLTGSDGKPDGRMIDWHRMMQIRVP